MRKFGIQSQIYVNVKLESFVSMQLVNMGLHFMCAQQTVWLRHYVRMRLPCARFASQR